MKIVLDTNVLVSGVLSAAGPPGWIVEAVLAGELDMVFDAAIRQEYEEVLRGPELGLQAEKVDDLLAVVDRFSWEVAAVPRWPVSLPDPGDEPFLAVAGATGCVLVTGNVRHFPAEVRRGVEVRTPRQFVERQRAGAGRKVAQ